LVPRVPASFEGGGKQLQAGKPSAQQAATQPAQQQRGTHWQQRLLVLGKAQVHRPGPLLQLTGTVWGWVCVRVRVSLRVHVHTSTLQQPVTPAWLRQHLLGYRPQGPHQAHLCS